jgi:3-hydroxybutyryl-CoA dehydrogenase
MRIALISSDSLFENLSNRFSSITWIRLKNLNEWDNPDFADALFVFDEDAMHMDYTHISKPVLAHGVADTLRETQQPNHVSRINAWPGFLDRELWELSGQPNSFHKDFESVTLVKFVWLKDEPGFVTPRTISMIINEAYFTKEAGVSEVKDIDIALKLGTNYPFGPFEWAGKIGIKNIYGLLKKLSLHDARYNPCKLLEKEADK